MVEYGYANETNQPPKKNTKQLSKFYRGGVEIALVKNKTIY